MPASRYETDFQELRRLGQGGFGLVVAAINRLDGRQYAIKKIPVDQRVPAAYARILREVATLSRLNSPHVVRYFQAWCEWVPAAALGESEAEDSELQAWEREGTGLHPVMERSSEGVASPSPRRTQPDGPPPPILEASAAAPPADPSSALDLFGPAEWLASGTDTGVSVSTPAQDSGGRQGVASRLQEVLFIQMEYCPRTLRDVLDAGDMQLELSWKVLRQIAIGLAHIHSQGIIHRDLKPANIFFDARGDIKLGDLGLAKFTSSTGDTEDGEEEAGLQARPSEKQLGDTGGEGSGVMGTSFYISPEIRNAWASYDSKVDIYSLGVVALELWHPFATGMERIRSLEALRDGKPLPQPWATQNPAQASLVQWLTAANPGERPSARELLASPLLPASLGDEQLRDVLRSMDDHPDVQETVLEHLFAATSAGGQAAADELPGAPSVRTAADLESEVRAAAAEAAARHGAVPLSSVKWGPGPRDLPAGTVQALLPGAQRVCMPTELRQPFATWLAAQAHAPRGGQLAEAGIRRYEVAHVYRAAAGRVLPRGHLQADVDFVAPQTLSTGAAAPEHMAVPDAEIIKVVLDMLQLLPDIRVHEVRLSHRAILDACMQHIDFPREARGSATRMLASALSPPPSDIAGRNRAWRGVRAGLEGLGLPPSTVTRCRQLVMHLPGAADESAVRLRAFFKDVGKGPASGVWGGLAALEAVVGLLRGWGVAEDALVLEPLLPPHSEYYSGTLFQIQAAPVGGSSMLVAVGGRYDALLRAAWAAEGGPAVPGRGSLAAPLGVGVTVNLDRLVAALSTVQGRRQAEAPPVLPGLQRSSQADVLVAGKGSGGLLTQRCALLGELWAVGVKAEMLPDPVPNMTVQYRYASLQGVTWLVVVANDQEWRASNSIRLRNLKRGVPEVLISIAEAPAYLAGQLGVARRAEARDEEGQREDERGRARRVR